MKITYKTEIVVGGLKHVMTTTTDKAFIDEAHKKHIAMLGFKLSVNIHGGTDERERAYAEAKPMVTNRTSVNGAG